VRDTWAPLLDKSHLGLVRYLHFLAVAYLVAVNIAGFAVMIAFAHLWKWVEAKPWEASSSSSVTDVELREPTDDPTVPIGTR